jgi:hypothetical protein
MTDAAGPGVAGVPIAGGVAGFSGVPIGGGVGGAVAATAGRNPAGAATKKTAVRIVLAAAAAKNEDAFTALWLLEELRWLLLTSLL